MENNLGNKEIMAKNITRYMQAKGVNRADFCRDLGFNYNTVSDWIHARKYTRIDKIEAMARYFGITKADLVEPAPPPSPASSQPYRAELTERDERHGVKIPILGRVVAGLPAYADQEVLGYDEITQERARTGEFFALIVRGDSMEPLFMAGDHVIVERQPDVDSGDVAIVGIDGEDATIKRVQKVDGGIILQPENRAYKPMYFSDKDIIDKPVTIFGRVVEQRRTKF